MTLKSQTKSLRSIFLRNQIIVSMFVLAVVTAILVTTLLALANYIDHRRTLELSQSIEIQAQIAKSRQHLQHTLTQMVRDKRAQSIVIYAKDDGKIIAANSFYSDKRKRQWIITDNAVNKLVAESLTKGVFGLHFNDTNNRRISILPLGPTNTHVIDNNIILGGEWPIPAWHKMAAFPKLTASTIFQRVHAAFDAGHDHNFHLEPAQYTGAVVIETNRGWIANLVVEGAILIAVLMALGFFSVLAVQSQTLRRNVLQPVRRYLNVITARRSGDHKARVTLSGIREFDELAHQWNSLLDYRDVAHGQNMVLSNLLEYVPVGIDVSDAEGNIEYANPCFLQMTGYSLAEIVGETSEALLASNKMDHSVLGNALVAITNGEPWSGEINYLRKDGSDLICSTTYVPICDDDDNVYRLITVRHDITKLKNNERDLIAAKTSAETADKAKSEFLSNMSHELRTPLNSIIGFSEMMAAQKIGPMGNAEYVEFAKLIESSSRTLLSSISLILDVSRLDAQSLQLNQTTFCISELLHKLIESKIDMAHSIGVEIKRNLDCKHHVRADHRMLQQALSSVINNAIRYNIEGGQVFVDASENNGWVTIVIKDTGIGISEENLLLVTEPFFRVDGSHARMKDGAGLGLTLVKKFTDEQKIDFKIESQLSHGTTITLALSIDTAIKETPEQPQINNADNQPSREIA